MFAAGGGRGLSTNPRLLRYSGELSVFGVMLKVGEAALFRPSPERLVSSKIARGPAEQAKRCRASGADVMSINALLLDGWDETSTWGVDKSTFYAQLTRNGMSDDGGPQVWISDPSHLIQDVHELAHLIAAETGEPIDAVVAAMGCSTSPECH